MAMNFQVVLELLGFLLLELLLVVVQKAVRPMKNPIIFSDTNPGFLSEPMKKMDQRCKLKNEKLAVRKQHDQI